jgi:eukaryotic-like serine/threonine-protein kinase
VIGRVVSHYRILSELGRGGMGIVYAAEDTLLGRQAALKFLPEQYAGEPHWLARFQREARAASALNHPNICTIYEIGEQDGHWFIAMELLKGRTLDRVMTVPVPMQQLIDWSIQISDALDVAHRQGVVHRDLKPSNIFLTERDQPKVLDFGLAKFEDASEDGLDSALRTASLKGPLTTPGQTVGTIAYMSPEQVRGDEVDGRSDLFSFGTVLYQMVTARMPFEGKTSAMTFDAILNRDPLMPTELNAETPPALERIIEKALEKSPELRYQSASDLRADLKRLKRDSGGRTMPRRGSDPDSGRGSDPLATPMHSPTGFPAHPASGDPAVRRRVAQGQDGAPSALAETPSGQISAGLPFSGAAEVNAGAASASGVSVTAQTARGHLNALWLGIGAVCVAVLGFAGYWFFGRTRPVPFQDMRISRVTSSGNSLAAAMSADGRYAVRLRREANGLTSLWIRHLATNSNVQILPPTDQFLSGLTFGSEGDYVYFLSHNGLTDDLYRIPVLGGPNVLITHGIDSQPSFSRALKRFCFLRGKPGGKGQWLLSAKMDGSDERVIYSGSAWTYDYPAWSQDGRKIALQEALNSNLYHIAIMDAATGKIERSLALPERTMEPTGSAWMPDSSGLIVGFRNIANGRGQIGYLSVPGGVFHRITNDLNSYSRIPSLSQDGKTISAVLNTTEASLDIFPWTGHLIAGIPATSLRDALTFAWVSEDRIIVADREGAVESIVLNTGVRTPVFSNGDLTFQELHPCGAQMVVFTGIRRSEEPISHIDTLRLDGGAPRQISKGNADVSPVCSPDGKQVIYFDYDHSNVHRISVDGGGDKVLVSADLQPDRNAAVTPDGREIVVPIIESGAKQDQAAFAWVSIESGAITKRVPVNGGSPSGTILSPDGRNVIYTLHGQGSDQLWSVSASGGKPKRLTEFPLTRGTYQGIESSAFSPSGRRLGLLRTFNSGDLVVFQDQQH